MVAGSEDNGDASEEDSDWEFFNLVKQHGKVKGREEWSEDTDIEEKKPGPNYLNNSFTGPYPEDMSRPYVDKGPNPQFLEFVEN